MKYSTSVTSSRRKTRKAHFTAPSSERRKIMSAPLASELKAQYGANAVPIRVNDEVRVTRGKFKNREGKVEQVYRKKWVIHIKNITRDKVNGTFRWRRDRVARHDGDEGEDDDSRKALVRVGGRGARAKTTEGVVARGAAGAIEGDGKMMMDRASERCAREWETDRATNRVFSHRRRDDQRRRRPVQGAHHQAPHG